MKDAGSRQPNEGGGLKAFFIADLSRTRTSKTLLDGGSAQSWTISHLR
jgi:hypothetical protein